jgi:hypothetical protein
MRFWLHRYALTGRLHLDRSCDAIVGIDDDRLRHGEVGRPRSLLRRREGRPCRRCGLTAALDDLLEHPLGSKLVRCTISAHGIDTGAVWDGPSPSGQARLTHLAQRHGWPLVNSAAGPIAYTVVTRPTAHALAANLRCLWDDGEGPFDAGTVAALWSLAGQFHGEQVGATQDRELWRLAAAVTA